MMQRGGGQEVAAQETGISSYPALAEHEAADVVAAHRQRERTEQQRRKT